MKKKSKLILLISLAVLIVSIGLAYAYYLARIYGNETSTTISADGGEMDIAFTDGTSEISNGYLKPSDSAFATKTFTVTGSNTTVKSMAYSIDLVIDANTFNSDSIKYSLVGTNTGNNGTIIQDKTLVGIPTGTGTVNLGSGSYTGNINDVVHTYTLSLFYLETFTDQSSEMGSEISAHVLLTNKVYAPTGWFSAGSGTLLSAIRNANNVTTPLTTPGRVISTSSEAVLASTQDDYGTSYYYRGAVENNYVSFAGMCWRIVRVTGNGAIKLALYNYNPSSASNPCDSTQDGTSNAFARYSGDTYTTAFNTNYNQNAYIGFMYGTAGSSSYAEEHANINKSTILTNLEAWYNAKLSSYASKLADTIWCNDKSTKATYTVDGTAYGNGLGYGTNQTMYGAFDRIYARNQYATAASPTLICPNDNDGGRLSKFTAGDTTNGNGALDYKIGLLTADEITFAGGTFSNANSTYYLNKNASSTYWWSLSPIYFDGSGTVGWHVDPSGFINSDYVYNVRALRPAVSLASSTTATGTGTQANPYVVE